MWDLLASGPRRDAQRDLIGHAIGPVWESNHVWLIFAIVAALHVLSARVRRHRDRALNVPLTLVLRRHRPARRGVRVPQLRVRRGALARTLAVVFGVAS